MYANVTSIMLVTAYIFEMDIHVLINWHLPKQGDRWSTSRDHIVGSSLELTEVSWFFFQVDRWPGTGFRLDCRLNPG